jgi:hypothetical protein
MTLEEGGGRRDLGIYATIATGATATNDSSSFKDAPSANVMVGRRHHE